jgi:DNA primase
MSTIDEVKSKIDIVDLVSEAGVKLRHAGRNYTGFCPFHDNKHTPAFVVWPESGTWRCFGQCNEGGDIFKFVMKREGLDFKDALQKLADRAGVKVESFVAEKPEVKEAHEHLRVLLEDVVIYYRSLLFKNNEILTYLREKRGLTDATIETFGLGYAPHGYDNLLKHFLPKGYSEKDLIDAGMLSVRDAEDERNSQHVTRSFDRFRNRIMIPIRDELGKMAGFGARIVDPTDIPKFLNSPETPIFTKGKILYGLDRARKPIRAVDQAVIVEGYLDVIALHQAGYENVISPMGTALTEDQLRLLKKLSRRIVLALDPDTAGQKAVLRGLDAARSAMDREGELGFDARGLLRNEARLQADLRVASMPDGLDPDELVARDKEEWKRLIENAKPIVTHVMDSLAVGQNLNDAKVKNQIAAQVIPLIEDLPNALERDTYRQALARMLKVDESVLTGSQSQGQVMRRRPRGTIEKTPAHRSVVAVNPNLKIETYCLGVLLRRPDLLYRLDKNFQEFGLSALAVEDFEYTDHQLLFGVVRSAVEQDQKDHHHYVMSHLPETISDLSRELVAQTEKLEVVEDKVLEDLLARFIDLRRANAMANNNHLRFLQDEDQQQGGANIKMYQEQNLQLTRLLHSLDQAKRKLSLKRQA